MDVYGPVGPSGVPLLWRYGVHRVMGGSGDVQSARYTTLPQAALRLDADPESGGGQDYEILLDVERLNIDSASFRQMEEAARAAGEDLAEGVGRRVVQTVGERGKMHNPVTGSGGMLLGRVRRIGAGLAAGLGAGVSGLAVGERIATLVSLTLTPLRLDARCPVRSVRLESHQLDVNGTAVLFASGAWSRLPEFLPERAALSALDVAGAAPQVGRLVGQKGGGKVLLLGCGGKSGLLTAAAARRAGAQLVIGVEGHEGAARSAERLGACHKVLRVDATDAILLAQEATACAGGEFDLVVSCVNVPGAEMSAILSARDGGTVYFFSMSTCFTAAALGAEGVSKDIDMLVGNGYCKGHAEATLQLLREDDRLREIFVERYG